MSNKNNSGTVKLIGIIIALLLALTIIPTGIYYVANPDKSITKAFSNSSELIVGKWQNDSRSSAYEFFDDGTYESYFSTFTFSGDYSIKGNKLTLINPSNNGTVVYEVSVNKKTLEMKVSEGGDEYTEDQVTSYNRVERIETKSLSDLLTDIVSDGSEETDSSK